MYLFFAPGYFQSNALRYFIIERHLPCKHVHILYTGITQLFCVGVLYCRFKEKETKPTTLMTVTRESDLKELLS